MQASNAMPSMGGRRSRLQGGEADPLATVVLADLDVGELVGRHTDAAALGVHQPEHARVPGDDLIHRADHRVGRVVDFHHQLLGAVGDAQLDLHAVASSCRGAARGGGGSLRSLAFRPRLRIAVAGASVAPLWAKGTGRAGPVYQSRTTTLPGGVEAMYRRALVLIGGLA